MIVVMERMSRLLNVQQPNAYAAGHDVLHLIVVYLTGLFVMGKMIVAMVLMKLLVDARFVMILEISDVLLQGNVFLDGNFFVLLFLN